MFIFRLAIGSLFKYHTFPMPLSLPLQCTGTERTDFIDLLFFFFFYNEGIIALLCSSLANHQTRGNTNCLFSSSDVKRWRNCF